MSNRVFVLVLVHLSGCLATARPHLKHRIRGGVKEHTADSESCTTLKNRGTHSTVAVNVGTPPRTFDIVADTGSDAIIVASCDCIDSGFCQEEETSQCYISRGRHASKTHDEASFASPGHPALVTMEFGSGMIKSEVATDEITVGSIRTHMKDGLLLMVEKELDFNGPFEGILGLGIPQQAASAALEGAESLMASNRSAVWKTATGEDYEPPEFLTTAGIKQFSLCLSGPTEGVLRFGNKPTGQQLGSIGRLHWGVGLNGISVGPVDGSSDDFMHIPHVCSPAHMVEGQVTPCGAIPDSGTTLLMGPSHQLIKLFDSLCDNWDRCKKEAENAVDSKGDVFANLLGQCDEWLTEEEGLSELPALNFHVSGSEDKELQVLQIGPWSYVVQTEEEDYEYVTKHLGGVVDVQVQEKTGNKRRVCSPAFGAMEMNTVANGDVWIFGTAFFYEFNVHYDLSSDPPSISFGTESCGSCDGDEAALYTQKRNADEMARRQPRTVNGPMRVPAIDLTKPL